MSKKVDIRKQLEAGIAVFLSEGKQIKKSPPVLSKKKKQPKQKEEYVEIDVGFLPAALQKKYFGEE